MAPCSRRSFCELDHAHLKQVRIEDFNFTVGRHNLAASWVIASSNAPPDIVYFHGLGARATRKTILYLLKHFAEHGYSSLCFDFSGNGDSTGRFDEACLRLRVQEAEEALGLLGTVPIRALIGTSMGAHIAASLLPNARPHSLILYSPVAYPDEVADVCFGESFTNRADRFVQSGAQQSSAINALSAFTGNLLLIAGEEDTVAPRQVVNLYESRSLNARRRRTVWLSHCGHFVHPWLNEHQTEKALVLEAALGSVSDC